MFATDTKMLQDREVLTWVKTSVLCTRKGGLTSRSGSMYHSGECRLCFTDSKKDLHLHQQTLLLGPLIIKSIFSLHIKLLLASERSIAVLLKKNPQNYLENWIYLIVSIVSWDLIFYQTNATLKSQNCYSSRKRKVVAVNTDKSSQLHWWDRPAMQYISEKVLSV